MRRRAANSGHSPVCFRAVRRRRAIAMDKEKKLELLVGVCPAVSCSRRLLFRTSAKTVKCHFCRNVFSINQLPRLDCPLSTFDAMQQRMIDMTNEDLLGGGLLRSRHRMIDGIVSIQHETNLAQYFENYGVTNEGRVKHLSDMGRAEPINVIVLSDYAFAIKEQHLDVSGYGRDRSTAALLFEVTKAVNEVNGVREDGVDSLVPCSNLGSFALNSSMAISKACVGRSVFGKAIYVRFQQHAAKFGWRYKRLSRYTDDQWSKMEGFCQSGSDAFSHAQPYPSCVVDLACLANVMARTILLLDPSEIGKAKVFLPFLWTPDASLGQNQKHRSPLVVSWSDKEHASKVAMVAVAKGDSIPEVFIPKSWMTSVWGFPEMMVANEMLSQYIRFDDQDRCVVASGKYFEAEFMRYYAMAFEQYALHNEGALPGLASEYVDDLSPYDIQLRNSDFAVWTVMQEAIDGRLWRCMLCEKLTSSSDSEKAICTCEGMSGKYMRKQRADGSIEYFAGDHTFTPAPNSWCFKKRKHYYHGREYDNPPMRIALKFESGVFSIEKTILWFSGESDENLNSNALEMASQMLKSQPNDARMEFLVVKLQSQIEQQVAATSRLDHQMAHLKECTGSLIIDQLFDDCSTSNRLKIVVEPCE